MSEEMKENQTTENEEQVSLVELIYQIQDSIESILLCGCGSCGWEGPFWRVQPANKCPSCGSSAIISAFEANALDEEEREAQEHETLQDPNGR